MVADDGEKKLPTLKELSTPENKDESEKKGEEKPETVIEDYDGVIVVHKKLPDGPLDEGREFGA